MTPATSLTAPLLFATRSDTRLSEPYECGWAREALVFAHLRGGGILSLRLELSADGERWLEAPQPPLAAQPDALCRLRAFGGWLRLRLDWSGAAEDAEADVYLVLKS